MQNTARRQAEAVGVRKARVSVSSHCPYAPKSPAPSVVTQCHPSHYPTGQVCSPYTCQASASCWWLLLGPGNLIASSLWGGNPGPLLAGLWLIPLPLLRTPQTPSSISLPPLGLEVITERTDSSRSSPQTFRPPSN